MKIIDPQSNKEDAVPSNMSIKSFAQAMGALDLKDIPPHKRKSAVTEHLARVMHSVNPNNPDNQPKRDLEPTPFNLKELLPDE